MLFRSEQTGDNATGSTDNGATGNDGDNIDVDPSDYTTK